MKTLIAAIYLICAAVIAAPASADAGAGNAVTIQQYKFVPKDMTVSVGTAVKWTNQDQTPHNVIDTRKGFRSSALDTGDAFTHIFTKPGVYKYYCGLHPFMTGTITVTAAK